MKFNPNSAPFWESNGGPHTEMLKARERSEARINLEAVEEELERIKLDRDVSVKEQRIELRAKMKKYKAQIKATRKRKKRRKKELPSGDAIQLGGRLYAHGNYEYGGDGNGNRWLGPDKVNGG